MQIDNFTTPSLLIFTSISALVIIFFLQNYLRRESLKQTYTLMFTQSKIFYLRYIFLILAIIISSLSIFKFSHYDTSPSSNSGLDIVFVLDVSKSMNVVDVKVSGTQYSRLQYTKKKISEYIISHEQNRYGLVIFAGDGISISPLSENHDRFLTNLAWVNYSNIATQWTDLAKALELWYARFGISENDIGTALVLISDGWDSEDTSELWIFEDINSNEIATQVLGVGTKKWWPIPIWSDAFGTPVFQKYQWNIVTPKLNTRVLKDVANNISWEYGLLTDFENQLDDIEKKSLQNTKDKYKQEYTNILVAIASIFFILYLLFPYYIRWRK